MLALMNLTGQLLLLGTLYYTVFSNNVYAGVVLVVGHVLFEASGWIAKRNLVKEIERFQVEAANDLFNSKTGNC